MLGKIIRLIISFFRLLRKRKQQRQTSEVSPEVKRIGLLTGGLKIYKRRDPQIRYVRVNGFAEAHRFLLRMCNPAELSCKSSGGYIRYTVNLTDSAGTVVLTNKGRRHDKSVIGSIAMDIPALRPAIHKIMFILKQ